MELSSLTKLFEIWLAENKHNFEYCPIKISPNKYMFDRITESIHLQINDENMEVMITFSSTLGDYYDSISIGYFEKVVFEKGKGYTDLGWIDQYKGRYFNTYKKMVNENLFAPILEFCSRYFIVTNSLYLVNMDSCTFGIIGDWREQKEINNLEKIHQGITAKSESCKYKVSKINLFIT